MSEADLRVASENGRYEQASNLIEAGVPANNTDAVIIHTSMLDVRARFLSAVIHLSDRV
jgi:hypothetical protein